MNRVFAYMLGAGALLFGSSAFAAADPEVTAAAATVASTTKENIMGAVSDNVSTIVIAGVLILSILVIWRLGKRFVSGR